MTLDVRYRSICNDLRALDLAYDQVNALGGATPQCGPIMRSYWDGYGQALDDAMAVINRLRAQLNAQADTLETAQ